VVERLRKSLQAATVAANAAAPAATDQPS
jgi:hypothetical protein